MAVYIMTVNSVVSRVITVLPGLSLKLITPATALVMEVPTRSTINMFRKPKIVVTMTVVWVDTYWAIIKAVTVPGVLA